MTSSATMMGQTPGHIDIVSSPCGSTVCEFSSEVSVSNLLQDDADREERIRHHRECMEAAMREYERTGCFSSRGQADYHRIQFEREIKARSPQQIEHMERELDLAK